MLSLVILCLRMRISCAADADGRVLVEDLVDCAGESTSLSSDTSSSDGGDFSDRVETVVGESDDDFRPGSLDADDFVRACFLWGEVATELSFKRVTAKQWRERL